MHTLTGGTDPMWDTHSNSNGASPSHRRLQWRKDKSEGGPRPLQPLPSPAPHSTAVTAHSHPSGHDAAHLQAYKLTNKNNPISSSLQDIHLQQSLFQAFREGCSAEDEPELLAQHSAPGQSTDMLRCKAKGVLEIRNTAIKNRKSGISAPY